MKSKKFNTMKSKISFLLMLCMFYYLNSCKESDPYADDTISERMPQTQFRQNYTTGKGDEEQYATRAINYNDMYLAWYTVDGAAGYRIVMQLGRMAVDMAAEFLVDTIVGPDVFNIIIEDLEYGRDFRFAIQVLSPKDDPHNMFSPYHSYWYGLGEGEHDEAVCSKPTERRPGVPDILWYEGVTLESVIVCYELSVEEIQNQMGAEFELNQYLQHENGRFIIDEITVAPSEDINNIIRRIALTDEDKERGYIEIDGLTSNVSYSIDGVNYRVERNWDKRYNTLSVRIKGIPGDPVRVPHTLYTGSNRTLTGDAKIQDDYFVQISQDYNACRLDTVLTNYMSNNDLVEGTEIILESGKTYFIQSRVDISKGLTLKCEDPNNRAVVLMGIGFNPTDNNARYWPNFSMGRAANLGEGAASIDISSIIFENIVFHAPMAQSFAEVGAGSGNYFFNQLSGAMNFVCESFELYNCDFSGFMRGWVRVQGANRKVVRNWIVDRCLFYNMGPYDANGGGYGHFGVGDHNNPRVNMYNNVRLTNTSFIDCAQLCLFRERDNVGWVSNIEWNIAVENCTFLNFNTVNATNGRMFWFGSHPTKATFTFKKNLFILTKSASDPRTLYQPGMTFVNRVYASNVFDIADNYQTSAAEFPVVFTANPFDHADGAGFDGGVLNIGGYEELSVKTGETPISPTQLMVNPNPVALSGKDMYRHDINYNPLTGIGGDFSGLYYNNTTQVRNHEIVTKGIGDPRWKNW